MPIVSVPQTTGGGGIIGLPAASIEWVATGGLPFTGVVVSEALAQGGETFTVSLQATSVTFAATGSGITGSGTNHITIAGNSLSTTNTILGTLVVSGSVNDSIVINATDSLGNSSQPVTVPVQPLVPAITAPLPRPRL